MRERYQELCVIVSFCPWVHLKEETRIMTFLLYPSFVAWRLKEGKKGTSIGHLFSSWRPRKEKIWQRLLHFLLSWSLIDHRERKKGAQGLTVRPLKTHPPIDRYCLFLLVYQRTRRRQRQGSEQEVLQSTLFLLGSSRIGMAWNQGKEHC